MSRRPFDVFQVADVVGAANLVVAFDDDDFVVIAANELQDFTDGLAKFGNR